MKKVLFGALVALAMPAAQASPFNFSYTRADNAVVTGQVNGTLQADNNTVIVNSLNSAALNGFAAPSLPFAYSTDFSNFGTPGLLPKLTVNGSFMDFIACNVPNVNCAGRGDGLTFNAGNASAATFSNSVPFDAYDGFFGSFAEPFVASRWRLGDSIPPVAGHVVDGVFTTPGEWTGPTVSKSFFPVVDNAGGAYLYVDQGTTGLVAPPFRPIRSSLQARRPIRFS